MTSPNSLPAPLTAAAIKYQAQVLGFHRVGISNVAQALDNPDSPSALQKQRLQAWLNKGYKADMAWMNNPKRQDIYQVMPDVKSIISLGLNYYATHQHSENPEHGKISRYAWGRDYHRVLGKRLKALCQWLAAQNPQVETKFYVDTGPISDKAWAEQGGLGWVGKNGNLISRQYGSWLFIGEILINLDLEPDLPHANHCGTCTRCLEACPTQAIVEPYTVDANRCIAYHTIENRQAQLPKFIAENLQGWVAGCDICQDVCPWNQRFAQATDIPDFEPRPDLLAPSLTELATFTEQDWEQKFTASALRRIKPAQWRRNAQANLGRLNPQPQQD
ncbi:tRNA epoxyqueuosine(34) reductase QueG [Thermosynechococcaceae cyanobacterium BACA0444]|uniref:Epoxyqueuosine reductase n=1 Tax=Pseudocalidococcus azoricus BACA0444 TaxID=2918990 RepID=A0AAE4FU82_9CYAN|nr:tRNA epoxyqueuosine(34) reductase QueG [Pseudocalidococcus azoricus]MDS3861066.1 tRNA epoxyqueuosine(34) reductase QueG [Pseudocalidococcus azoricus BACA0444]